MPVLKETEHSFKNVRKRWENPKTRESLSAQEKEAMEHMEEFGRNIKETFEANTGVRKQLQIVQDAREAATKTVEQLRPGILAIADAQASWMEAMRPNLKAYEKLTEAFKPYQDNFAEITKTANLMAEKLQPLLSVFSAQNSAIPLLKEFAAPETTHIRDMFREITDLTLGRQDYSFLAQGTMPSPPVFIPEATQAHELSEQQMDELVERLSEKATQKLMEKMEAKALSSPIQTASEPQTQSVKGIQWDGLEINYHQATLQYRDNDSVEIGLKNQEIRWLACVLRKSGDVAQYVEIAFAIGHISKEQMKTKANGEVARNVQMVKKLVVKLLKEAGMTQDEINTMIVVKRGQGFAARKIHTTQMPQK